jgi:hypothetical protein
VPTINSPLGSKSYQGGMKEFVVPDEAEPEMYSQPAMPQVNYQTPPGQQPQFVSRSEIKRSVLNDNSRISEAGRKRIEMLCGMSQVFKEIELGENLFVLRSLKSKENREALTASLKYDGTIEFSFELRKQILVRSLVSVAGVDVDSFLGTTEFSAKLDFIDELDDAVSDRLYNEYLALNNEIKKKYALKNDQDVKEVVEDIKKS